MHRKSIDDFDEKLARLEREQAHEELAMIGQKNEIDSECKNVLENNHTLRRVDRFGRAPFESLKKDN